MNMLKVDDIYKSYGREPVLCGVSFLVSPGQILGICGANGSGKTTLINIIASILPADKGSISLMDISVEQTRSYRSLIGYVPQSIALSPRLTVRQNLEFWASIRGCKGKELRDEVNMAAELANIGDFMKKQVGRCSGGMARRANLAAGLVGRPQLLLLDEPTAGIDEENRDLVLRSMETLRSRGCLILMVSHYKEELALICERIITLKDGLVQEAVHAD